MYVFGGYGSQPGRTRGYMTSTEILDVRDLTWSDGPSLPFAMGGHKAVESEVKGYLGFSIGGFIKGQPIGNTVYGLQNSNGNQTWVEMGQMAVPRGFGTVVNAPTSLLPSC